LTKVLNAFYRDTAPRAYVDRAPHFTANGAITVAAWKGWSGSARVRAINSYRLDQQDASLRAAGHTVFDMSLVRRLTRQADFLFSIDNFANRRYYETQNFIESRPFAGGPAITGIHGTPGYPVTFSAGLTFRFRGK
jgi:outer membrane receptor protein involved in Fe transport